MGIGDDEGRSAAEPADAAPIRVFEPGDRPGLIALWRRCDLTRPWNDPDRDIDRKLAVGDGMLLVAVDGHEVVGSVMGGYDGHRGWINYLAVDPDRRGRGLGARLVQQVERRLDALGCPKVNLQIRSANAGAAAFYGALGYVVDDVVSMGKRLVDDTDPEPS